jgi:hypothetical protein
MGENQARRLEEWGQGIRAWSFLGLLIAWQLYGSVYAPVFFASLRLLYAG